MNFIIILIGFDIDIFTQLNTTVPRQSLLLVLLFSNTISAIRPEDPPRKEKWILGTARRQLKDSSSWIEGSSRGKRWHNDHPHWHWTHCVCCRLVHILNWLTILSWVSTLFLLLLFEIWVSPDCCCCWCCRCCHCCCCFDCHCLKWGRPSCSRRSSLRGSQKCWIRPLHGSLIIDYNLTTVWIIDYNYIYTCLARWL